MRKLPRGDGSARFCAGNFDTVGTYRTIDPQSGLPIDSTGTMPDGTQLAGPCSCARHSPRASDQFAQIITEKLMTYGVGRHLDSEDMPAVRAIVRKAKGEGLSFESLVRGVVNSAAFRRRAPKQPAPKTTTAHVVATAP